MTRIILIALGYLLTLMACAFQGTAPTPTPTTLPTTATEESIGNININPGTPTALPAPNSTPGPSANDGDIICRVSNANRISNVAVRREPNTNAELFYAIQPTYTASVLEIREVPGRLPWYFVRVDNPIRTDLEVVEGWVRSDTVIPSTPCN